MKTAVIFIGEGDSERYFIPSFLKKLGFVCESDKQDDFILVNKKEGIFWLFPFPPCQAKVASGKSRLVKPATYQEAFGLFENRLCISGVNLKDGSCKCISLVLSDSDGKDVDYIKKYKTKIENAIKKAGLFRYTHIFFAVEEIESWFCAGLTERWKYFKTDKIKELKRLLYSPTDGVTDVKEKFLSYIDARDRGQKGVAVKVANDFDVDKALKYSASFRIFYEYLRQTKLI